MQSHDIPKLGYSIREACQASSLGRTTIYSHISAGRLRAVRVGGRTIIPAEALHALIAGEVPGQQAEPDPKAISLACALLKLTPLEYAQHCKADAGL